MFALQAQSSEDFPRYPSHRLSELGPGYLPRRGLGHLLLLHLEGSQVHWQGETWPPFITFKSLSPYGINTCDIIQDFLHLKKQTLEEATLLWFWLINIYCMVRPVLTRAGGDVFYALMLCCWSLLQKLESSLLYQVKIHKSLKCKTKEWTQQPFSRKRNYFGPSRHVNLTTKCCCFLCRWFTSQPPFRMLC